MERLRSNESFTKRDIFETEDEEQLVAETREILQSLDEEALKDIFIRELQLSSITSPEERLEKRFIPFEKVKIDGIYDGSVQGSFNTIKGITLNSKSLRRSAQMSLLFAQSEIIGTITGLNEEWIALDKAAAETLKNNPITGIRRVRQTFQQLNRLHEQAKRLQGERIMSDELMQAIFNRIETIHTLVHEELHAITTQQNFTAEDTGSAAEGTVRLGKRTSGLKESSYLLAFKPWTAKPHVDEDYHRFTGLNEGVTELHARRLSQKYLTQTLPKEILNTDLESFYDLVEIGSYNRERWVTEQLVLLFAAVAEVPPEIIEQSLFRAYLSDGDFLPEELLAALRHDMPHLSKEYTEELLLKLQIALSEQGFESDADINRIFIEFADLLPEAKRTMVKDGFKALFYKYSFSKELQDGVVEK